MSLHVSKRNMSDQLRRELDGLYIEQREVEKDMASVSPRTTIHARLKLRLTRIDERIDEIRRKRLAITPVEASQNREPIHASAEIALQS